MIDINISGGKLSKEEIQFYIEGARRKYPEKYLRGIDIELDGDYVNTKYHFSDIPFQRIRRITGYLVGTLDRFNNAKRSEEKARVKHNSAPAEEFKIKRAEESAVINHNCA